MTVAGSIRRKTRLFKRFGLFFRRRLKGRPDSEHEMMLNRLGFVSVALGYLWLASFYGSEGATDAFAYGIALCSVYALGSLVLLGHIIYQPGVSHVRRSIALVMDMVVLSLGMHLGDSAFALGYPIYLWIIFGNGFRFGVRYLAASAAAAVIGFAGVIMTTPIWVKDIDLALGLMVGLVLLPAYVAALIRKLSDAKRQAEEASKAKSMFLASVSHELRTPLNAIITLSDLLEPMQAKREPREMVQTIATSGRSLLKMINSILDLSRIEAGKSLHVLEDFKLHSVAAQVRRVLKVQADGKGLKLGVWIGASVPCLSRGSAQDFEEILTNLIGNAIKFTAEGGVWVSIDKTSDLLEVTVRDTGIGIAEEAQKRIFESFVQADASIIDRFGGTGLGLSIVKQLVERNGGAVSVSSEPGKGSTFSFTFRVEHARQAQAPDMPAWNAIILSRNLAVEAELRLHNVSTTRVALPHQLLDALTSWSDADSNPVVIVDVDTVSDSELDGIANWRGEVLSDSLVGILSSAPSAAHALRILPFTVGLEYPLEPESLAFFGELSRPFGAAKEQEAVIDVCARPLHILAAEDNMTNQKVLSKLLERDGHIVTMVSNGELAVEALTKAEFDLVLMDINMPLMNGLEATKLHRFASLGRARTPIYALTADVTPETQKACQDAGMDGCLHKPIEQSELQAVLFSIAGRKSIISAFVQPKPDEETEEGSIEVQPLDLEQVPFADAATLANLHDLGGTDFIADLVAQFTADALQQIDALMRATEAIDAAMFRDVTHSLRSSAANIGARRMFALCLEWRNTTTEDVVKEGDARIAMLIAQAESTQIAMADWIDQRRVLDRQENRKTA